MKENIIMMSRLDKMIKELCPGGVMYLKIEEIADYEQPTKYIVKSTDYSDEYEIPVLTAGQTFILGYTNETNGIFRADQKHPVIIFDDFTGAFKWVDFPFKVKSSAMKIITVNDKILLRYLYHVMGYLNFASNEHKRLWISTYSKFIIPLPPLEIQHEIVRILDNFAKQVTQLQQCLEKELKLRKKQYEYYRNMLLDFETVRGKQPASVVWKALGEVCEFSAGGDVPKEFYSKEKTNYFNIPVFSNGIGDNALYGYTNKAKITKSCVTFAARGTIGYTTLREQPFYPVVRLICAIPKSEITVGYLYYISKTLNIKVPASGIPQLTVPMLSKYKIPIPPIEEQERIVAILDRFDRFCNDLTNGLPEEIAARQKQYAYYRDKLLSFNSK